RAARPLFNAGKRGVVVTARNATPEARVVEVAGEETVTVTLALHLVRPAAPTPQVSLPARRPLGDGLSPIERRRTAREATTERSAWPVVLTWTTTGLLAAGTTVAGLTAISASRDLHDLRDSYPVALEDLQQSQRRARRAAYVTDALLAGTALLAGLSLYVTLSGPTERTTLSVGPGSLHLSGRF